MTEETKPAEVSPTAQREEEILQFWKAQKIFEKSIAKDAPNGEFVFYDGPPFATGLPHYGHIVASVIKDVIPRYYTMKGYSVPRVWGWDCHGLPIENIVEKELGFKHKKEIEKMGVSVFNEKCREQVLVYAHEWEKVIPRIGRWADMEHAYKTMDKPFMESVWWVFKQLWDKGLVYEDYRAMHICPRCETTLSQQEVSEGYMDVKDISVTVKFKLKNPEKLGLSGDVYALAWTTTPWTLPGNVALAVGKDIVYQLIQDTSNFEMYVIAKERNGLEIYKTNQNLVILDKEFQGSELVGLEYIPPFDYYYTNTALKNHERGWKVYAADFVTADSGTGIAHEAPAFGDVDMELGKKENLPFIQHVNMDGTMKPEVTHFAGMEVKPKSDDDKVRLGTDIAVLKYLQENGTFFSKENIVHSYPHCWRCDTPLLNYATTSWFVAVTKIKDNLLANAETINWSPEHIKAGRFGKWLEGARDWSISRQRFWASVIPVWVCVSCKAQRVFGSAAELEQASGAKIDDLHKHIVDTITVPCTCGAVMKRIPDVLDTWFDSGSMPYGEKHYPFENKEKFEAVFPAQFIAEGLDQTRAWFYYLHVLAGGVFGKPAFQNVIVNGIALAEDGKKMSKKLKNYPDPMEIVNKYGADSLRLYLMASPIVQSENLSFTESGVQEIKRKVVDRLVNMYELYATFSTTAPSAKVTSDHVLDQWMRARLAIAQERITANMDAYVLNAPVKELLDLIDDISTWYVRRSRERIKGNDTDAACAISELRHTLLETVRLTAPFAPFVSEDIWRKLEGGGESVHLAEWNDGSEGMHDAALLTQMHQIRDMVSVGLEARMKAGIKVRQPLAQITFNAQYTLSDDPELIALITDELNVKKVIVGETDGAACILDTTITPELEEEGYRRELIRALQEMRKEMGLNPNQKVILRVEADDAARAFVEGARPELSKIVSITDIIFDATATKQLSVGPHTVTVDLHVA